MTNSEELANHSAQQTPSVDSSEKPPQKDLLETPVTSALDNLADGAESIYIKPDPPGINRSSLTNSEAAANHSARVSNSIDSPEKLSRKENIETPVTPGLDNLADGAESIYIELDPPGINTEAIADNLVNELLNSLNDIESSQIRFTSSEELNNFISSIERTAGAIEPQLSAVCPDYFDRLAIAGEKLELLGQTPDGEDQLDEPIKIEIPIDEDLKVGDRFYDNFKQCYGRILRLLPASRTVKVLFDGAGNSSILSDEHLVKVRTISIEKSNLSTTVNKLKEITAKPDLVSSIKTVSRDLFLAAKQYILQTEGAKIIGQLTQLIKTFDYETYMELFC